MEALAVTIVYRRGCYPLVSARRRQYMICGVGEVRVGPRRNVQVDGLSSRRPTNGSLFRGPLVLH